MASAAGSRCGSWPQLCICDPPSGMFFQHVGFSQIHKTVLAWWWQVLRSDCCVPRAYSRTHATHSSSACEWAEQCVCLHSSQVLVRVWARLCPMYAHSLPLFFFVYNLSSFHCTALQAGRYGSTLPLHVIFSCWLAAIFFFVQIRHFFREKKIIFIKSD